MIRKWLAGTDSMLCRFIYSLARYQAALLTGDGDLLPVESACFHSLANAEWWVHEWAPRKVGKIQPRLAPGSRWIIQDLT